MQTVCAKQCAVQITKCRVTELRLLLKMSLCLGIYQKLTAVKKHSLRRWVLVWPKGLGTGEVSIPK